MIRNIAVVTVARSDYGLYFPVLKAMESRSDLRLSVIVAAAHLAPEHGSTVREITEDGFQIAASVEMLLSGDSGASLAGSMGIGLLRFADAYRSIGPDLLILLGDRAEMFTAAAAAVPMSIPIAHVHGGEVTAGAMDDSLRHAMTKLSHLHFVATRLYAKRVEQMGEEPWRVTVSGSPAVDNLLLAPVLGAAELSADLEVDVADAILVTFHPVTLEPGEARHQIENLLQALEALSHPLIFTAPNADPAHAVIRSRIESFVKRHPRARVFSSLGRLRYPNVLRHARLMVGNSSSGLIEAPSFGLPAVNIGSRQEGRIRAENVIDVGYAADEIRAAVQRALGEGFRRRLRGMPNPYGDGNSAGRIVDRISSVALDAKLLKKRFVDLECSSGGTHHA